MKTCTQGAERKGANQKAQRASIRKRFYIMKTRTSKLAAIFTSVALAATMLASCGGSSDKITVISREDGSGTRGAFIELTGIEEKDSNGNKTDNTKKDALICKSTDVVLTQVSGDKNAIGYISFGSLNDTVKGGVVFAPKSRDFSKKMNKFARRGALLSAISKRLADNDLYVIDNIAVKDGLSDAAQDFENYILSSEGQDIIEKAGYIKIDKSAAAYASNNASGKVVVSGSSSVTPVMEKLAESYQKANTNVTAVRLLNRYQGCYQRHI